ncbi:MFS transporter [Nonomuraea sp. CA-141351]|uniref:MFS transporter n=1 Tax=Nonomuraea sp. CA-141351 TaxID=3239996 RepID=UPI003D937D5F
MGSFHVDREAKPERGSRYAPLRCAGFRRYLIGQLVSNIGTWMQRAAQDLLILHLTGDSGAALGILTALQFAPQILFGLYGGLLADRCGKRRLLLITHTLMGIQALLLGALTVTGAVTIWHLYALALSLGTFTAIDGPARNAFIAELVDREQLPSAVSLSAAQFNIARILGPASAGMIVALAGSGVVFLLNAASYLAALGSLLSLRADQPQHSSRRDNRKLIDAFQHIRTRPHLLLPITLIGLIGTFGFNFQVTTALMTTTVFHSDPVAFGYVSACYAAGSLVGAILAAGCSTPPTPARLITSAVVFGVLEAISGLAPGCPAFMTALLPTGLASAIVLTTANAMTQLNAGPGMRGRVMSIYLLVLLGGTPIGAPLAGLISDTLGARYTLILGGLISALGTIILAAAITLRRPTHCPQPNHG